MVVDLHHYLVVAVVVVLPTFVVGMVDRNLVERSLVVVGNVGGIDMEDNRKQGNCLACQVAHLDETVVVVNHLGMDHFVGAMALKDMVVVVALMVASVARVVACAGLE